MNGAWNPWTVVFVCVFGLLLGSYVSMLTYRLPKGIDTIFRRSHCPSCQRQLSLIDLIPVIGGSLQGWRCKNCQVGFSKYSWHEWAGAALALISAGIIGILPQDLFTMLNMPAGLLTWASLTITLNLLLALAIIDWNTHTLPEWLNISAIISSLITMLLWTEPSSQLSAITLGFQYAGALIIVITIFQLIWRRGAARTAGFGLEVIAPASLIAMLVWLVSDVFNDGTSKPLAITLIAGSLAIALHEAGNKTKQLMRKTEGFSIAMCLLLCVSSLKYLAVWGSAAVLWGIWLAVKEWLDKRGKEQEQKEEEIEPTPIGFGDVMLAMSIGMLCSPMAFALALCTSWASLPVLLRAARTKERHVPFGPVMILGALLTLMFGEAVNNHFNFNR